MEYAGYNFKLGSGYGGGEIIVKATNYKEAVELANSLLKGSKVKLGDLTKVIDCRLQVQETEVLERRLLIDERQLNVNHSGELTEIRIDGGKRNSV